MIWSQAQLDRFVIETQCIAEQFSGFQMTVTDDDAVLGGWLTSNAGNLFGIRLRFPREYPHTPYQIAIVDPCPLLGYAGRHIPSVSHDFHTLERASDGAVVLCHSRSNRWTSAITSFAGLSKARLWIEALELHRSTGKPISEFIATQS